VKRSSINPRAYGLATSLAAQQKGAVRRRSALEVVGLDARTYSIEFDGKTEQFKGNEKQANALLTREYRKGFEVPKSFPTKETSQASR